ncbi:MULTISPECIES: hypothetical protein [unclassified Leifsonia]|uniref:hypothetical protein n=1 Tax=unclassified Leifsonia TaxID=2663824 RepID=UPI0008A73089|nr:MULTISPECIES: hypothetical protein [unclassified Leifsonia]SEH56894.1 hypothetical protein SAMN04515694_101146 [Leifsonia sp. CL154]SFL21952.1 hypothetical protein SAMN04515692_101333 [Leifsonia sp. CL147]
MTFADPADPGAEPEHFAAGAGGDRDESAHLEIYLSSRDGAPIAMACTCGIGKDHTFESLKQRLSVAPG